MVCLFLEENAAVLEGIYIYMLHRVCMYLDPLIAGIIIVIIIMAKKKEIKKNRRKNVVFCARYILIDITEKEKCKR